MSTAYRDDPEMKAWYRARENVTYTDGSPVREGDAIRFHQAPGGLMPHGDWQYGVAAYLPARYDHPSKELHLLADDGRYYILYSHVIERVSA